MTLVIAPFINLIFLRIKPINHASAWVLKEAVWWGLWKYADSSDESAEIVYLAPWLIIYFKLNPFMSTLHNQGAWNWRSSVDLACNFKAEPPFFVHLGFEFWVEQQMLLSISNNSFYQAANLML